MPSTISLIATIIVAILAIVVAGVAVMTSINSDDTKSSQPAESVQQPFQPTQEFVDECTYKAHDLVAQHYSVMRLFVTEGLPHFDEPYGNLPEDGLYTVNSTAYTSVEQIEELVRNVYIDETADKVLNNIDGKGLAVYRTRTILVDIEYDDTAEPASEEADRPKYKEEQVLGISADFTPDNTKSEGWGECSISCNIISETECELAIYLSGTDAETAGDSALKTNMIKVGDAWKLTDFVY